VKVGGKWSYLYRALDNLGDTIDFYLSPTRNMAAAKHFLPKAHRGLKDWDQSPVINTDKAPTYAAAPADLKPKASARRTRSTDNRSNTSTTSSSPTTASSNR
jgi:IS6 family transposase